MNKYLLIRYGELILKGKNRNDFSVHLYKHINILLKRNNLSEYSIDKGQTKIEIKFNNDDDLYKSLELMKYIIGISTYSIAYEGKSIDDFNELIVNKINEDELKTFKVEIKRRQKTDASTYDKKVEIATNILKSIDIKVDVINPELTLKFELYKDKLVYIHQQFVGKEGLPTGSNGRALVLLSGGIDSPVAAYKMMARGLQLDFLSFEMPPNTSQKAVDKINSLAHQLNKYQPRLGKMYYANITPFTDEVRHSYTDRYNIILMRRAYIKVASIFAQKKGYLAIITGDSLGQVASQTIEAQNVIKQAITSPTMFQPLIGINKKEIIDVAKDIGTYELSIVDAEDTCSLFVPKSPVTKPRLETALLIENSNDLLPDIIEHIYENIRREEV